MHVRDVETSTFTAGSSVNFTQQIFNDSEVNPPETDAAMREENMLSRTHTSITIPQLSLTSRSRIIL